MRPGAWGWACRCGRCAPCEGAPVLQACWRRPRPTRVAVLTRKIVGARMGHVDDVAVIDDPAAAEVSLDPIRARLLAELAEPGSASTLAARVGLTRQKANYHLRALERHGLVELVEERRKGNCTERVLQATAASYVISPAALSAVAPDPSREPGPALRALAARGRRAPGPRGRRADHGSRAAGKPLATLGIDSEVRFASARTGPRSPPSWRHAVNGLVAKYHDERARRSSAPVRRRAAPHASPKTTGAPVMSREFEITREVDLPAAPDDVWTAITAEHRGLAVPDRGWRSPPAATPEGAPIHDLGPAAPARDPHGVAGRDRSTRSTTRSRRASGGTAHLRYVHSGILADEWEDQYDAIDGHTDFYLHTLGQYLEHFNGRRRLRRPAVGRHRGPRGRRHPGRDGRAARRAGRRPDARVGDPVHASLGDAGTARRRGRLLRPRIPRRAHRRRPVPLLRAQRLRHARRPGPHLFAPGVDREKTELAWRTWLDGRYG